MAPVTPDAMVMPEPVRLVPSTIEAMPWPRSVTASVSVTFSLNTPGDSSISSPVVVAESASAAAMDANTVPVVTLVTLGATSSKLVT